MDKCLLLCCIYSRSAVFTSPAFVLIMEPEPTLWLRRYRACSLATLTKRCRLALRDCGLKGSHYDVTDGSYIFDGRLRDAYEVPVSVEDFDDSNVVATLSYDVSIKLD